MMASNLISRLLPPRDGPPSVYETLRQHDELSDASDLEERAAMAIDEENLGNGFEDYELDHADAARMDDSQITAESAALLGAKHGQARRSERSAIPSQATRSPSRPGRPKWMTGSRTVPETDEGDDEVPPSLLTEHAEDPVPPRIQAGQGAEAQSGPSTRPTAAATSTETRSRWEAVQAQQRLHRDSSRRDSRASRARTSPKGLTMLDPRERALWRWANVQNLDNFLKDVYDYFLGNGIWCIVLGRALNLLYEHLLSWPLQTWVADLQTEHWFSLSASVLS